MQKRTDNRERSDKGFQGETDYQIRRIDRSMHGPPISVEERAKIHASCQKALDAWDRFSVDKCWETRNAASVAEFQLSAILHDGDAQDERTRQNQRN